MSWNSSVTQNMWKSFLPYCGGGASQTDVSATFSRSILEWDIYYIGNKYLMLRNSYFQECFFSFFFGWPMLLIITRRLVKRMIIRILQVMMLRAKFGKNRIRTNLLQRCYNNFCHFNNIFCYKIDKTIYDFSNEIRNHRLLLKPTGDSATFLTFGLKFLV